MSDTVIRVENLSKRYRIGMKEEMQDTFAGVLTSFVRSPLKNLRRLRRLSRFDENGRESEDIIWALKDVSFQVKRGEVLGIIGRNGAGKSTLLKILSRITHPTSGRVELHGRVSSLLEVGTGFHPELTGRENIFLNGTILGMSRREIDRKFDEIVDFSGVEKFIDTPVKHYSSGMYVRLAFAIAAHLEPEILLVDEVLAVGDAEFQRKCLGKMGDVAKEGRTVLFVSHNMMAVRTLCQRGIFLNGGGKICDSTVDNAIIAYLDSIEKSAQQDISQRTDRSGLGMVRLKGIDAFCDGIKTTILSMGMPVAFHFHISDLYRKTSCTFTIYDQYSQTIATFNSANLGIHDNYDPDLGHRFICEFDKLMLYPGRYRLNVALKVNNTLQDHVEGALVFNVEPGRLEGRLINPGYAKIYLEHQWKCPIR